VAINFRSDAGCEYSVAVRLFGELEGRAALYFDLVVGFFGLFHVGGFNVPRAVLMRRAVVVVVVVVVVVMVCPVAGTHVSLISPARMALKPVIGTGRNMPVMLTMSPGEQRRVLSPSIRAVHMRGT
jgi:hypothetical protein